MFHVPEESRIRAGALRSVREAGNYGAFLLASPEPGWWLVLICDDGTFTGVPPEQRDWEHVSVSARGRNSLQRRTPNWKEMAFVKDQCWDDEDVVVQYHPRKSEYVNHHPHVLHLWRHRTREFPTPPPILVGPTEDGI
jgi:hypothetical protein